MKKSLFLLCFCLSVLGATAQKTHSVQDASATANREPLEFMLQREGFRFANSLTAYSGFEPATNATMLTTSVAFPVGEAYYVQRVTLFSNRSCTVELQFPKDPRPYTSTHPLVQQVIKLQAGVERTVDLNIYWPQGARFEARYQGLIDLPVDGYRLLTASATVDLAISKLIRVSSASATTVTLDAATAKVGDRVVVQRATGATGTVTVASTTGSVQSATATTYAATQGLRSDNYIELVWDGVNWNQPVITVTGTYSGYRLTFTPNLFAKFTMMGVGDSGMRASSGVATGSPWHFTYFNRVARHFQQKGYDLKPVNLSIAGITSTGVSDKINYQDAYNIASAHLILYGVGMNDAGGGVDAAKRVTFQNNLNEFLTWARGRYPYAKIIVLGPSQAQEVAREAGLALLRLDAEAIVAARTDRVDGTTVKIHYLSLGSILADPTSFANYATTDTNGSAVHLNQVGHDAAAQLIINYVVANNITLNGGMDGFSILLLLIAAGSARRRSKHSFPPRIERKTRTMKRIHVRP